MILNNLVFFNPVSREDQILSNNCLSKIKFQVFHPKQGKNLWFSSFCSQILKKVHFPAFPAFPTIPARVDTLKSSDYASMHEMYLQDKRTILSVNTNDSNMSFDLCISKLLVCVLQCNTRPRATIPAKIVGTLCRFLHIFSPGPPLLPVQC